VIFELERCRWVARRFHVHFILLSRSFVLHCFSNTHDHCISHMSTARPSSWLDTRPCCAVCMATFSICKATTYRT
jgi:hypothetical protein